jgi:UDP-N-acetylmuramyl pentapeptide synthase
MKLTFSFIKQALPASFIWCGGNRFSINDPLLPELFARAVGEHDESQLAIDSRKVKPGSVFIALPGEKTNGHLYLNQAVSNGARALIVETSFKEKCTDLIAADVKHLIIIEVVSTYEAL